MLGMAASVHQCRYIALQVHNSWDGSSDLSAVTSLKQYTFSPNVLTVGGTVNMTST